MERRWSAAFASNRPHYGRWLCRDWNTMHSGQQQLDSFKITYMLERSVPPGQTPTVEQIVLWRHGCFAVPSAEPAK
ncbi:MAG: hypothetical protein Q8M37_13180 [Nevskia sp.]|nr:hypothetical protein [Nevskia sp.]